MRAFLFKDFAWKLFSLLLAAFIWYTVNKIIGGSAAGAPANSIFVTYGEMPVHVVASAADIHLFHVNPDNVSVTVSGPAEIMSVLRANQIHATVELSGADPGKTSPQPVEVSVPAGVTVVKVVPDQVDVIAPAKP
jgi:YbbR domain-containing protein